MNIDIPAPTQSQESFLVESNFKELDNSSQRRPSIRELLSRSDSSEAFESLSRGEYVGNLLSIVLSNSASLSSPEATGCAGDSKCEVKFQTKNRYGRENRRSFMRSVSSIVDEYNDQLTSSPILSRSDDSDDNLDITVLPRFRRKSFIFNDYRLSKEALMDRGLVLHNSPTILSDVVPIELSVTSEKLPPITTRRRRDSSSFISSATTSPSLSSPRLTRTKTSRLLATNTLNRLESVPQLCVSPSLKAHSTFSTSESTSKNTSNNTSSNTSTSTSNTSTRCGSPLFIRLNPSEIQIPCPPRSRTFLRSRSDSVASLASDSVSPTFSPSTSYKTLSIPTPVSPVDSQTLHTAVPLARHESMRVLPRLPSLLEEILAPMGGRNLSPAPVRESTHEGAGGNASCTGRRAYSPVSVIDSVSPSQSCRPTPGTQRSIQKVNRSHD